MGKRTMAGFCTDDAGGRTVTPLMLEEALVAGMVKPGCRAVVALPARNEETTLAATLDALRAQVDLAGRPLVPGTFEVLLLLNNCSDRTAAVAREWQRTHPEMTVHCCERELPQPAAHIGTVRKMLMDTAWRRLQGCREVCAILSTDSDSYAAPDWIARTLRAIEEGADAVGGELRLIGHDYESLPDGVRAAYAADRRYQYLLAEMEDLFDPQAGDPWPRHLEHFGASLACTPEIYARAGGMPAVAELEDVAFVDRLRRVDARLRHEPGVVVYTSARMDGRIATGLAGQLRCWQRMHEAGERHQVLSAEWLLHRFLILRRLRRFHDTEYVTYDGAGSAAWVSKMRTARKQCRGVGEFLASVDCDRLMEETFLGEREGAVDAVNAAIARCIVTERGRRQRAEQSMTELMEVR